jgi:ABC-type multidrug transport system fused ATPase/permease subunit
LKRLEAVNKSPIYSLFGEMIAGASTIRAYGHQHRFIDLSMNRTDLFHRPYYFLWVCNRWLSIRVELVCSILAMVSGFGIIVAGDRIDAALAGVVLNFVLTFTTSMMWLIRLHAELEMAMNSVERVFEYLEIEQEADAIIPHNRPPTNWPQKGEIKVDNFYLTYSADLEPVLRGLTFNVKPGEKVGIVGRTGAGKSTISLGLFRFIEAMSGKIIIDGIDISTIGLHDLRGSLTIIPQDPVLFTGTLRSNLDPDNIHSDEALYRVLKSVHLIGNADGHRTIHPDLQVQENGSNFSVGQRALICLARALLRDSKVIFIDEATASIDVRTDSLIQETIRDMFSDSTVLTIAHRLRTIVDYDRVLVLDQGRIVEYDTPYNLITKTATPDTEYPSQGLFLDMCEKSGEFDVLFDIAKQKAFPLIQP